MVRPRTGGVPAAGLPGLPRLLVAARDRSARPIPAGAGLLLHDLSLLDLVRLSARPAQTLAVDLDSIEGLAADEAAIEFLAARLGITVVITRRPGLAARAPDHGCLSLLHVHCLDSTGLDRALAAHPGAPVGTAVSPGLVLAHLSAAQRRRLHPPVLAYGLIRHREEREAAVAAGADGVVVESENDS
ncbi:MAG TPA: glycerol-3-phosphate responsive antiterminator [Terriglobales bacterium]|nr:glycerol-3-phosphate responsive antiterminator [Terriglobales bacterium]